MSLRKIKLQTVDSIDDFRLSLLKELKIIDYKRDCLVDYEERITKYLKRNSSIEIEVVLFKNLIYEKIYNKNYLRIVKPVIPNNYPWGASNMETQNYYNPPSIELLRKVKELSS